MSRVEKFFTYLAILGGIIIGGAVLSVVTVAALEFLQPHFGTAGALATVLGGLAVVFAAVLAFD